MRPLRERFEEKVLPEPMSGCHLWTAFANNMGYGTIGLGGNRGKKAYAHRVAWTLENGDIPEGRCVLHRCDNPLCVNVDHLFLGTKLDNSRDMVRKGRQSRNPLPTESQPRGERHGCARLTEADVRRIRELKEEGVIAREIAARFGISKSHARRVYRGHSWSHV